MCPVLYRGRDQRQSYQWKPKCGIWVLDDEGKTEMGGGKWRAAHLSRGLQVSSLSDSRCKVPDHWTEIHWFLFFPLYLYCTLMLYKISSGARWLMGDEWRERCMSYGQLIIQCVALYWYVVRDFVLYLCSAEWKQKLELLILSTSSRYKYYRSRLTIDND